MRVLSTVSLSLVLFMIASSSCGGGNKSIVKAVDETRQEQAKEEIKITTFELTSKVDSTQKVQIGSRSMGKARSGEMLSDKFAVKNTTDKPLVILEVKSNCGCLVVNYAKEPMKAGDTKIMNYTYDSRGKVGQQFSEVTIKTNIGDYFVLVDLLIE